MLRFTERILKRTACLVVAAFPVTALADVVWPALYLETRLFSWWAIGLGLLVEFFFVRWLFGLSVKRALLADFSANAISSAVGLILIPVTGLAWEVFPASAINWAFGWGTFNPVTWAGTFLLACLVTTLVEGLVYRQWFVREFRFRSRQFVWLFAANALSVGVAFGSLWISPVRT